MFYSCSKLAVICALSTAASLAVVPAVAQTAGNYSGTAADGSSVSFTVTDDGSGNLSITSFGFSFTDDCHPGSSTFSSGWGLGTNAPITASKASFTDSFGYLYAAATFKFNGGTVTGTILNDTPTFAPTSKAVPSKSVFCSSPKQSFTASISGSNSARIRHLAPGEVVMYPTKTK